MYKNREELLKEIYDKRDCNNTKFSDNMSFSIFTKSHICVNRKGRGCVINTCYSLKYNDWDEDDIKDVCKYLKIKLTKKKNNNCLL